MQGWTESHIRKLQADGKIRGYRLTPKTKKADRKKFLQQKGKQKYWIELNLQMWCNQHAVEMVPEYQFLPNRKFRFDWAIPSLKIAVEYEGIFSPQSRHTNKMGYSTDAQKYNLAIGAGWKVLRYTAVNYKNLLNDIEKILK